MKIHKRDTFTRRRQIARAALEIVAGRGVTGLSVARIARRIGLVPSALYRHFPSKARVLAEVLDAIGGRLQANLAAARAASPDAVERLRLLLFRQVEFIKAVNALPRLMFSDEVYGEASRKRRLRAHIRGFLKGVAGLFAEGQAAGVIRRDVPARRLAVLFVGLFQPVALMRHLEGSRFSARAQARAAWRIFESAIRRPRARRRRGGRR
jgi:AcrR family transcriptional regulator